MPTTDHSSPQGDVERIRTRIFGLVPEQRSKWEDQQKKRKSQSPPAPEAKPKKRRGRPSKSQIAPPSTPLSNPFEATAMLSDEEGDGTFVIPRKRKSILQPSGSKYSKKARKAAGRRLSPSGIQDPLASDNNADEEEEFVLRPVRPEESPITTIKNGQHLRSITNEAKAPRRKSESPPPPDFLPRKFLELKVVEHNVYSMEPQGPGDLWTCPFEGCAHRVHKASSNEGKELIRAHFKTHDSLAEDKINLALNESRPYLPVKYAMTPTVYRSLLTSA